MKKYLGINYFLLCTFFSVFQARAQDPGSSAAYGGSFSTLSIVDGGSQASPEETIYIGPGTYQIDGVWEIYSKYVVIDPSAIIQGIGSIVFHNPADAGASPGPTIIDGNAGSNAIAVNLVHNNANGMQLTNLDFPADLITAGFTNNSAASSLHIGNDLNLAVDGADITLGTNVVGDLVLDSDATIGNFGVNRMVITNNSILSHVVKDLASGSFTFPIGIADGNYTPTTLTGVGTYHASVQDYSPSTPMIAEPQEGMDRTWHIYSDATGSAAVTLQHNTVTNGTAYTDSQAFITQYQGTVWSTSAAPDFVSAGVHTHSVINISTSSSGNASWLTKTSDKTTPLPVTLLNFNAKKIEAQVSLTWATTSESNASHFEIERSADARHFETIGKVAAKGESDRIQNYSFLDAPTSSSIIYYRLKMVDADGTFTFSGIRKILVKGLIDLVSVYPNPASEVLKVDAPHARSLKIFNRSGQILFTSEGTVPGQIDIRGFAEGIYIVQVVQQSGHVEAIKIAVTR